MYNEIIIKCLSESLDIEFEKLKEVDINTPLVDIGMTSLLLISFIVKIEEALDIEILDSDLLLENCTTLKKSFQTISKYLSLNQENIKKVLILDADNVLWTGVSGEENIIIDSDVTEFQKDLCDLYNRGVLLCLCSKNQPEMIDLSFSSSDMCIKKEYFTIFLANRLDKATNIETIVNELKLSPSSFVFADDSDYELGYISTSFPSITCVKVDYSTSVFREILTNLFKNNHSTSDLNRTQLYKEQKEGALV